MPSIIRINPSLGMLLPRPKRLTLAGRDVSVLELRLEDIAVLEDAAAEILRHPHAGNEDLVSLHSRENMHMIRGLDRAHKSRLALAYLDMCESSWPPILGTRGFRKAMATGEGTGLFLWVTLSRTNPDLTAIDVHEIGCRMAEAEWDGVHRIAWAIRPNESRDGKRGGRRRDRGFAWSDGIRILVQAGHSYESIGRMFLSQFLDAISGEDSKPTMEIGDWPIPQKPDLAKLGIRPPVPAE